MTIEPLRKLLKGRAPPAWLGPDFLPRPRRTPLLAWALLVSGALVFAVAGVEWWQLRSAEAEARQDLARWQRAALPERGALVKAQAGAAPQPEGSAAAAQALVHRLDHPWSALFQATELDASPGVRWLRLEHDAERGAVRLEGVANDLTELLRCLDALAGADHWHGVALLRLESGPASGSASGSEGSAGPLRFELRARHGDAQALIAERQ